MMTTFFDVILLKYVFSELLESKVAESEIRIKRGLSFEPFDGWIEISMKTCSCNLSRFRQHFLVGEKNFLLFI